MSAQPPAASIRAGSVAVGDRVISWYDDEPVEYGGPDLDGGGWSTVSFGLHDSGLPVRQCDRDLVAPVDTPIAERDPRVSVEKRPTSEVPYGAPGPWRLTLRTTTGAPPSWHRTRRDAIATGLRCLAILDWHAGTANTGADASAAVQVTLPSTGYVVLHTSQRDGEEPLDATRFIDPAGRMGDDAAIAYLTAEITRLAETGPANLLHTLRLVHRTRPDGDGDRELLAPDPVRGAGTPLPE